MSDPVKSPSHYQVGGFEVWDILDAFFPDDPHLWAAGKYLLRSGRKGDAVQDLEKCQQFLSRAISRRKETDVSSFPGPRVWKKLEDIPADVYEVTCCGFNSMYRSDDYNWSFDGHPFRPANVDGPFTEVVDG